MRDLALLALALLIAFGVLLWQIDSLGNRDDAARADVIVVLGARVDPDGQPSSDLKSRTFHAVDLFQAGYAPQIICTGGVRGDRMASAAVCKRFAMDLKVPSNRIWLADGSANTQEDAQSAAAVMSDHGWQSALLVSHPLHLYRARWLFQRVGIQTVLTSPTSTDTSAIDFPLRVYYASREAISIVITVLKNWGWIGEDTLSRLQDMAAGLP